MPDDGQLAAHGVGLDPRQSVVAILGYLGRSQLMQRYPSHGVLENDTQHVDLAVGPALSRHHFLCVTLQEVGQRMRSEPATVIGQAATINFGLRLSRP
jgi:hypothetical protein